MNSEERTARITGILYLLIIILAGFSQGYVRSGLIVSGDTTATAANIMASEGLFRIGFATDLTAFMMDAVVAILLYVLLRPVNKTLSLIAASFRLLAHPAIAGLNLLNHIAAVQLLGDAGPAAFFETEQLHSLVTFFLDRHHHGYLIAGAFFGVHLLLLGYLLFKSDLFPGILGILIALAGLGYLIESFGDFLFPGNEEVLGWIVGVSAAVGELSLTLWLLIKGVRVRQESSRQGPSTGSG
ncbi:MAG TPA: DUF4386 domain-containing protein [Bacteroides sp.]|nr:DUF4386 domain-containing protein [Bacteroides sp.]